MCGAYLILGLDLMTPGHLEIKSFEQEDMPRVLRIERLGRDLLYIDESDEIMPLEKYLNQIPDKYDRKIEKAKIEKIVDW
jgi:hypothetical protein